MEETLTPTPPPPDPPIVALDIETYGAVERDHVGLLPPQTHFHPRKMETFDGVHPSRQIPTVALTTVTSDPRGPARGPWTWPLISALRPASTLILHLHLESHRRILVRWLLHADTIIGWNLLFDLLNLRAQSLFRPALLRNHHLLDGTVLSFLENPARESHSLKAVSHNLHLATYPHTLADGYRFPHPHHKDFLNYQASDPHTSILSVASLARNLLAARPDPGPFLLSHFSDLTHMALRMSESGVPLSRRALVNLDRRLHTLVARSITKAAPHLLLQGPGSNTPSVVGSKPHFLRSLTDRNPSMLSHPLLELTEKKRAVSWSTRNRALLHLLLPKSDPALPVVEASSMESRCSKLISSFTRPLLSPKDPTDTSSCLLPPHSGSLTHFVYPSWYLTPSALKDDTGDTGGQVQARISAKHPATQTWPKIIKRAIRSRFGSSGSIVSFDLSQIELRVAALLSGEPSLIDSFTRGLDLHTARTASLFGEPFDPHLRQVGKKINFADLYRASAETMQLNIFKDSGLYIPLHIFNKAVDTRPALRPILWRWQESLLAEAQSTGRLTLPISNMVRYFPGDSLRDHENEIVNFPVQATASIVFLRILYRLHTLLPSEVIPARSPCHFFLSVHDSGFFDCLRSYIPTLRFHIAESIRWCVESDIWSLLQSHTGRTVPLKYDLTIH